MQHNFTGMSADGLVAATRRAGRRREMKGRLEDGRSTHFVVGYTPSDFDSETTMKFRGEAKSDGGVPAAGWCPVHGAAVHCLLLPFINMCMF